MRRAVHLLLMIGALAFSGWCIAFTFLGGFLLLPTAFTLLLLTALLPNRTLGSGLTLLSLLPSTLLLSWTNWGGPGYACRDDFTGAWCVTASSPWPFVIVSVLLAVSGGWLAHRGAASVGTCWLRSTPA